MSYRNKECRSLSNETLQGGNILYSDETKDGCVIENAKVHVSTFLRLGLRNARFCNSQITQSEFDNCYLRRCKFRNVDFTGSVFRDCNLDKASFEACTLRYTRFYNCIMDANEVAASLPQEPNLRLELARNLRVNFAQIGDKESSDMFLDISMAAQEDLLYEIVRAKTTWYKDNYNLHDRLKSFVTLLKLKMSKYVWGYGYKIDRLIISYGCVIVFYAFISYICKLRYFVNDQITELDIWHNMYFYTNALVTSNVANVIPATSVSKALATLASLTGAIFIAVLAAAVFQKISRK